MPEFPGDAAAYPPKRFDWVMFFFHDHHLYFRFTGNPQSCLHILARQIVSCHEILHAHPGGETSRDDGDRHAGAPDNGPAVTDTGSIWMRR